MMLWLRLVFIPEKIFEYQCLTCVQSEGWGYDVCWYLLF